MNFKNMSTLKTTILLVVIGLFLILFIIPRNSITAQTNANIEYKVELIELDRKPAEEIESLLNQKQKEGWTLFSTIPSNDRNIVSPTAYFIFKK